MNWVKKHKLSVVEAIQYEEHLCIKLEDLWNPPFNINVGVGQGSALSPILSALYLSSVFLSLENHLKILKIPISIISFVDNGLFIS